MAKIHIDSIQRKIIHRLKRVFLIFCCTPYCLLGQVLEYGPHSSNIFGNVKKIETYQYSPTSFDTLDFSPNVEFNGILKVSRDFDRYTGRLISEVRYHDSGVRSSYFQYDDNENLLSINVYDARRELHDTTHYEYDYKNREVIQTSIGKSSISVQGRMETIGSVRRILDSNNNIVDVEYLSIEGESLLYQRNYYDVKNRLVLAQDFEYTSLEKTNLYTYDTLDRKRVIQMIDRNGDFTKKIIYNYLEMGYEVFNYNSQGDLKGAHRVIRYTDENDNLIKLYNFNLLTKRTTVIEYKIEYF